MRILFASMPFAGHFLPMSGVAKHLSERGHDVRFYTGPSFAERLSHLGVGHVPFTQATEVNGENLAEHFPEIEGMKGPKRIAFDVEKIFFAEISGHYQDILALYDEFPFEVLVFDGAFYAPSHAEAGYPRLRDRVGAVADREVRRRASALLRAHPCEESVRAPQA